MATMGLRQLLNTEYFRELPMDVLCFIFTGIALFTTAVYFLLRQQHQALTKKDRTITRKTDNKEVYGDIFNKNPDDVKGEESVVTDEEERVLSSINFIEDILKDNNYKIRTHRDQLDYFMSQIKLDPLQIRTISKFTAEQAQSMLWFSIRRGRITSSNFGGAISLAKRNVDPTKSFMNYILKRVDISKIPAVKYGIDFEDTAIRDYESEFKVKVQKSGIVMNACGLLGGSPDGIIDEDGIIEVKCPYKVRDIDSVEDLTWLGYLKKTEFGDYELSQTHKYYHQCQGNIYLTNRRYCDFIVWSKKIMYCIRIHRDPEWEQNVGLMQTYYLEKVVPTLEKYYRGELEL